MIFSMISVIFVSNELNLSICRIFIHKNMNAVIQTILEKSCTQSFNFYVHSTWLVSHIVHKARSSAIGSIYGAKPFMGNTIFLALFFD